VPTPLLPKPVQSPRIPIWVAGTWPLKPPFRRAARWDGVAPIKAGLDVGEVLTPEDTRAIADYCASFRTSDAPFEVLCGGHTTSSDDTALPRAHSDAGATWWLEDLSPWPFGWRWQGAWPVEAMRERVRLGPPAWRT
jgi:alkanesulfonate monooxygenase SsuD/methylene tetrahydromethanopterin reductase-like flavin-dependent oxidoreductase (luciferase family)